MNDDDQPQAETPPARPPGPAGDVAAATAAGAPGPRAATPPPAATNTASAPVRPATRRELRFYATCRVIAVGLSRLYFPGRVVGAENIPASGAFILAPIHRSYVDWLIVARVTKRRLRYIAKSEVWKVKAVGRLLETLGAFPVQRGAADREAFNRALQVLEAGEPLVLFPEGGRCLGPVIGDLREGAAYLALRAGAPIVPVGLGGAEQAMPKGSLFPRPRRIAVVVGEPILPGPGGQGDGKRPGRVARSATHALSERLRQELQVVFDVAEGRPPTPVLPAPLGSRPGNGIVVGNAPAAGDGQPASTGAPQTLGGAPEPAPPADGGSGGGGAGT